MIELAIVCGTLVLCSAFASVFYLSNQLAITNRHLLDFNKHTLDCALAINVDERERMRIERAVPSAPFKVRPETYPTPFRQPPPPMDVEIPVDPNTGEPVNPSGSPYSG